MERHTRKQSYWDTVEKNRGEYSARTMRIARSFFKFPWMFLVLTKAQNSDRRRKYVDAYAGNDRSYELQHLAIESVFNIVRDFSKIERIERNLI